MNIDEAINGLELEVAGLDVELKDQRLLYRSMGISIDSLEADRIALLYRISNLKRERGSRDQAQST